MRLVKISEKIYTVAYMAEKPNHCLRRTLYIASYNKATVRVRDVVVIASSFFVFERKAKKRKKMVLQPSPNAEKN